MRRRQLRMSRGIQTTAPPGTPSHPVFSASRSRTGRCPSSAVSSEWNPLVPRTKPLSASGLEKPVNHHVKAPFKHAKNAPDMEKVARPMSPGQTMKERTALATYQMTRAIARQWGEEEEKPAGRLLKGRLKPLYPVKVDGPSMAHCRGVVSGAELEENSMMNSNSRTLARRRKIMAGMLKKDFMYEKPPATESLHHTSIVSELSEGRERDLDDELEDQENHAELPTPPHDGLREPPNSLASTSDPNFQHNLNINLGSGPSSVIFENDEVQKVLNSSQVPSMINDISDPCIGRPRSESARRPGTGKAVRFAEKAPSNDRKSGTNNDKNTKEGGRSPEQNGRCKPQSDSQTKWDEHEDDSDPSDGHYQGKLGQSQNIGHQGQTNTQGQGESQGQTEGIQTGPTGNTNNGKASDSNINLLRASYNTVLFTPEEIQFPRQGTVLPVQHKKTHKHTSKVKNHPQKSIENSTNLTMLGEGSESPIKDYYHQYTTNPGSAAGSSLRPQSARGSRTSEKQALLLQRPISARTAANGKEPNVQFIIKPSTDQDGSFVDDLATVSLRLNEVQCLPPPSARTQTSGVPTTGRSTIQPTVPRRKEAESDIDFTIEGSKMSQSLKAGACMVCGKLTSQIAEYWEETGKLVCEVCERRMHSKENQMIEWIRTQMQGVYQEESTGDGSPHLMLKENGEEELEQPMNNMDDLEKALESVQCEINEAIHDVWDAVTFIDSASSKAEDEEESEEEEGNNYSPDCNSLHQEQSSHGLKEQNEESRSGEISKILTEVDSDTTTLSAYKMRVDWYNEYSHVREKRSKSKLAKKALQEAEERKDADGNSKWNGAKMQSSLQVYQELQSVVKYQPDMVGTSGYQIDTMMEQQDVTDPIKELLQESPPQPMTLSEKMQVQHFKGQRVPTVNHLASHSIDGQLGVSGTAKKLQRPPSAKKPSEAIAPFAPLCFAINARPPAGFLYYFAYGADMNPDRMECYIQRSVAEGRLWGLLYGFRVIFNKRGVDIEAGAFPNVKLSANSSVEGCLYLITLEELDRVDRQVGYPEHYDHAMLPVWLLNCQAADDYGVAQYCVPALLLVAKDEWIHKGDATLCREYAVGQCIKGGGDLLSSAYTTHLTALAT